MEIVSPVVTPVVESLMDIVKRNLGYLVSCTKYVRDMGTKKRTLDAKRVDVEEHMNRNERNILVVPTEARDWLAKVVEIDEEVASISNDVGGCFNLKRRHKLGKQAFEIIEKIDNLIQANNTIIWPDYPLPLGKVDSKKAFTSTPSSHHNDFPSRERTFMDVLKQLQPDHESQMIALCGMGGVGKSTMMENLKKVAEEKQLFNMIVKLVIGKETDILGIQDAVAIYLGTRLTGTNVSVRSDMLHKSFESHSKGGKDKILVILDDVWQFVHLKDMGLSPLPNQGVGFKFLLTSRDQSVCTMMGVEINSIFKVDVIDEPEAHSFFHQFVQVSNDDRELQKIGEDIVRKCGGLPIAIKTIAVTLKDKSKDTWKDALSRLEHHDIDQVVHEVFAMSYINLPDEETKSFFSLCGLFPEDSDIPTEDLMRYGWGLELFQKKYSIRYARNRLNMCIERLIHANMLIQSQNVGCVKMHDLVRDFVIDMCSKGENMSIVGNISTWPGKLTNDSCKRISLSCTGMSDFPRNFKFPNLSLLKLTHGDERLKFPEDFYEDMKQLEVIAYDIMRYPLLSRSLQCSTNLRTLCLGRCSLMFDCSPIGDLLNLEVLSFAHCGIRKLPSAIGNLKELKLLDLTGCVDLIIDDGVLKNLIKLEEIYMKAGSSSKSDKKAVSFKNIFESFKRVSKSSSSGIRFTDSICNELVELSENFFALEIEFFDYNALPKNMSFKNLERFKISLGCYLNENDVQNMHSFENTLMLVTEKSELLDSRLNELFEKTEVLHLQVNGVNDLEDCLVESLHHQRSSFYNIRVLDICECANMKYIFTVDVANGLTKLERLTVSLCPVLETLVDGVNSGVGVIKFQALKFICLHELPKLMSLCNVVNVIELPQLEELILDSLPKLISSLSNDISTMQPLLNKKVVIPQLKRLKIFRMEKLKEIWPINPMSLLHHLEELMVKDCGSIEVLFNIDLRCVGKNEEVGSCLRSIEAWELENLREVWRIKGANDDGLFAFSGFQAIGIYIYKCKRFRNVFTPTTINFDMRALTTLIISDCAKSERDDEMVKSSQEQEINVISNEVISEEAADDEISNVVFSSNLIHTFHNLHQLYIWNYKSKEAECCIFIQSPQQPPLLPYLKQLDLRRMECMSHVWKCNWNKFLIPHQQESFSSFHNLTTIFLCKCKNIKYLFSPLMAKLLSNLKNVMIHECDVIEEVVSNRDDEDEGITESSSTNTSPNLFPHLDMLKLYHMPNLKRIGGGGDKGGSNEIFNNTIPTTSNIHHQFKVPQVDVVAWSLCQYAREIKIRSCQALPYVIPSYALGQIQKLEELKIWSCESLLEVFETQGINNNGCCTTNIDEGSGGTDATMLIPRLQNISMPQLSNLKKLKVDGCKRLQYVFTFSTIESLMQLEKLIIRGCKAMEVIVKVDDKEKTTISSKIVVFPRLKSIELADLPNLTGFFLGKNEFQLPLLDDVMIKACPQMTVFTSGSSITPQLNNIHTELGKYSLECGLNFPVMAATLHERPFSSLDTTKSCATTSEETLWLCFDNFIEMDVKCNHNVKKIIPSNELQQLQKLEKIHVECCSLVEVFEALEGRDSGELQSVVVVEIPKLREVELERLENLKYIWKNNPWMVLEFPNLTKLSVEKCSSLEHVFSSSMVGSLLQLQELRVSDCAALEVIVKEANVVVKEEECDGKVNVIIMLPRLKSLKLKKLPSLKAFCLGKEAFSWPSLNTLEINGCNAIRVFTIGHSTTPELKTIDTSFGRCELIKDQDLNSFINTKRQEGLEL